jgi:hypothetical protein
MPRPLRFWKGEAVESLSRETLIEVAHYLFRRHDELSHTVEALIGALSDIRPRGALGGAIRARPDTTDSGA